MFINRGAFLGFFSATCTSALIGWTNLLIRRSCGAVRAMFFYASLLRRLRLLLLVQLRTLLRGGGGARGPGLEELLLAEDEGVYVVGR